MQTFKLSNLSFCDKRRFSILQSSKHDAIFLRKRIYCVHGNSNISVFTRSLSGKMMKIIAFKSPHMTSLIKITAFTTSHIVRYDAPFVLSICWLSKSFLKV